MKKKQIVLRTLILVMATVFVLVGCTTSATEPSASDRQPETPPQESKVSTEATAPAEAAYEEKVTISHNITDAEKQVDNALYTYFSEKFNVEMQYIPMQFGERHEKARIWASSGDLPDLLWMDLNENIFSEWCGWVDSGLFAPVPSDLKAWPEIANLFDSMIGDELFTRNGDCYALACMRDMSSQDFTVCMNIVYRADWAEKLGMRKPDDVYTWNEFMDLIKACIEQDPGENGAGKTFGISAPQWYFPDMLGIYQTNTYEWGFEEPFFIVIDGQYVWYPTTDEYMTGLKIAKQLYDDGIIWPDNVVDTNSTMYQDLYYAGQMTAMCQHATIANLRSGRDRMAEGFPDLNREDMYQIAKVSSPLDDKFFWQKQSPCYWSANSISAKTSDAQRERILDMWNWLLTDEGMRFRMYGLEGTDYTLNADGSVELLWEKNANGVYIDPYPGARGFYGRPVLNDAEYALLNVSIPEADRIDGNKSWVWDWENAHIGKVDYNMLYASTPNKDTLGMFVSEVKAKAIELLINSTQDSIEADWKAWTESMMPKVQLVLDDLNNLDFIPSSYEDLIAHMSGED
ncbi:MAG: extracellular solute-binding protein [Bacillota bacterium]|nr:extracellular solute-binding protein [Bacillota bacterium]